TPAEITLLKQKLAHLKVPVLSARHWAEGGAGAAEVARTVVEMVDGKGGGFSYVYDDALPLWDKMRTIATKIYGAADISADSKVRGQIKRLQEEGYGNYPVCVAKTQYSFSTDPALKGAPSGHVINIREVRLAAGGAIIVGGCGGSSHKAGRPPV